MQSCDVLIVGGGPGGAACAWLLALAGIDVVVIDKQRFPRDKTCAGWVTPPVLQALRIDREEYGRGRVLQPIRGFRSGLMGGREIESSYEAVVSYGIRRCEFDHYLLQRSPARRQLGEDVRTFERRGGLWVVNGTWRTPLVIGAGGHFCPVARFLGARHDRRASVVAAQEIEFPADASQLRLSQVRAEVPEIFFCQDLRGYGWIFRKDNYFNIGLGRVDRLHLSGHVQEFCAFLKKRNKLVGNFPAHFHGHAYQLYERQQPRLIGNGMMLVGDAAGLAYPHSGEGIRPAVESGLIAADVILSAGDTGRTGLVDEYQKRITERFGAPRGRGAADWLPSSWLYFVASRLLASQWFSREVVMNRWFLHSDQPPLIALP